MKKPPFPPPEEDTTGRVARDDRGNAVWEWKDDSVLARRLAHPGLEIKDDDPSPLGTVKVNRVGAKKGYDPYESGLIDRKDKPRKRDLHALSRWIEQRKRHGEKSED